MPQLTGPACPVTLSGWSTARAGPNRGTLTSGWGMLVTSLEQKAPGRVEKVKAAYTSLTCNACKHVAADSRKSQATFVCVACGHQGNADVNAARNIAACRDSAWRLQSFGSVCEA
jgi:transposase